MSRISNSELTGNQAISGARRGGPCIWYSMNFSLFSWSASPKRARSASMSFFSPLMTPYFSSAWLCRKRMCGAESSDEAPRTQPAAKRTEARWSSRPERRM